MANTKEDFIEYKLPTGRAYANFDAVSLKSFITERLNENEWFTDHNFEGSNLAQIIDILSYYNHVLLFYLNKTSTEGQYSESQIYENMNRIVKLMGYKPFGIQTPMLNFEASSTLDTGTYIIPRYSFFNINGVAYSFIEDASFIKTQDGEEELTEFSNNYLLYQGKYERLSDYNAIGESNEIIEIPTSGKYIDTSTIDVYVKRNEVWSEWQHVDNIYESDFNTAVFETRVNERENIEIKFGGDVNGTSLRSGDVVSVYYLNGIGSSGEVAPNFLKGFPTIYSDPRIKEILSDVASQVTYITRTQIQDVEFRNGFSSTKFKDRESVDEIRENANKSAKSQNRLLSKSDFESHIKSNFGGVIASVKVMSNNDFLKKHIGYLNSIGVVAPFKDERILTNHHKYSSSCHFNNVYIYVVPRMDQNFSTVNKLNYVNASLKQLILQSMRDKMEISLNPVIQDPVFMAVGVGTTNGNPVLGDLETSYIEITRDNTNKDKKYIKDSIKEIISNYFNPSNFSLGQTIDIFSLTNDILNIQGVRSISTKNGNISYNGLSLYLWNPIYNEDVSHITQNTPLGEFQFAFFENIDQLTNKITVVDND